MVQIHTRYDGELHCTAHHAPSGTRLDTDAPVDNQGKGATFSPTDLVATALATCMLTTMGIAAGRKGWDLAGIELDIRKVMTAQPPRRIDKLPIQVRIPSAVSAALDSKAKQDLEQVARTCPVALSLSSAIEVEVTFSW
jgi:putative redox protein